jgi:glyoxylate reductase
VARVFVTRKLPGSAVDRLGEQHEVEVWPDPTPVPAAELAAHAEGADGLLTMLTDRIDAQLLAAAPGLRAVANYAVGTDNVDLEAATDAGVPVGNTPDVLTDATADLAWALLMAAARRLCAAAAAVRAGEWGTWQPDAFLSTDVAGATLGVVGFGRIGRAVARRAEGFGMEVLQHSRSGGVELDELLARSDFVSLHAPLTPDTRGKLVDTAALKEALEIGQIGAAGLDVTDPEPLPADHPLLEAPNLTVAPHIGSATRSTREKMADMAVDNLLAGLRGEPMPNQVADGMAARRSRRGQDARKS